MNKDIKPEVLAPAGSTESIYAAVRCGADLVIELPFISGVNNSNYFCANAVKILNEFQIDENRIWECDAYECISVFY